MSPGAAARTNPSKCWGKAAWGGVLAERTGVGGCVALKILRDAWLSRQT
ncbi:MAG: hypothetical protein HS123_15630 [Solibacteraceae bacterium]|nr:hypothetical protein [Solibacteraceae bacterium]